VYNQRLPSSEKYERLDRVVSARCLHSKRRHKCYRNNYTSTKMLIGLPQQPHYYVFCKVLLLLFIIILQTEWLINLTTTNDKWNNTNSMVGISGVTIIFGLPRQTFATGPSSPLGIINSDRSGTVKWVGRGDDFVKYRYTVLIHNSGHFGPRLLLWTPATQALPGLPMARYATGRYQTNQMRTVADWLRLYGELLPELNTDIAQAELEIQGSAKRRRWINTT